ncbi:MAG: ATP-binding protein, partial [Bacteroidota bacterium]
WFFMTQKKEQAYYALLWTGFLLGLLIPSPWGYYAAFNDFALLVKNFFDLSVAWTLMSTLSLWGILGFSIHYLNIPSYFPRLLLIARILALTPVAIFGLAGLNYLFPHWFSYDPLGLMGYIYRPSTIVRSTLLGVGFVFAFVMGILVHRQGFRPAKYYLIAFLPLTVAACLVALSNIQISIQEAAIGLDDNLNTIQNISICLALILFALAMGYKQKRLETDYREAQDKLVQAQMKSIEEQKKVNDRLRQMDSLKDQFLANTSHELRTPLNGIIGLSEALEGEESDPGKRENLAMIISSGKRLSSLVNDILDFSKLKNHEIELRHKPLDIHAVVDVVLRIHQPLIEGKDLKLINEIPVDTPLIMADEDRLQQILFNLVGNAAKFTERGFVKVSAATLPAMVEIAVTDTGIGIPENKREAIFQAFEQADGSIQREFAGTGLGLSISKQLVELHGGQMWVDSVIGEGSTFFATFPQASSMATPVAKSNGVEPRSELGLSSPKSVPAHQSPDTMAPLPTALRILVVDDEPINQQVIKNHLKGPDYRLTQAMDGEEALELIEGGQKF